MHDGGQDLHSQVGLVLQNARHDAVTSRLRHLSPTQRLSEHGPLLRTSKHFFVRDWQKGVEVTQWYRQEISKSPRRSCPVQSRDGAVFVVDMTGVTSVVAPWRPLAWSLVLQEDQPPAEGSTRAL